MNSLLLMTTAMAGTPAWAKGNIAQVTQIFRDKKRGISTLRPDMPATHALAPAPEEGRPHVAPSITNPTATPTTSATTWNRLRFSLSLGYSLATQAKFDSVIVSSGGASSTGKALVTVEPTYQLSAAVMWARPDNWGFLAGLTLEQKRPLKKAAYTFDGTTTSFDYTSPKPTIQINIVEASALYRWGFFYLPFGINYAIPTLVPKSETVTVEAKGGFGAQIGAGFIVGENLHFEIYSQALSMSVKEIFPAETDDYGSGLLSGVVLRAGYSF